MANEECDECGEEMELDGWVCSVCGTDLEGYFMDDDELIARCPECKLEAICDTDGIAPSEIARFVKGDK